MRLARLVVASAAVLVAAGCSSDKPVAAPTNSAVASTPSPSPSATLPALVVVDAPAREACTLLIKTGADQGEASADDPLLPQVVALLTKSQHYSLRTDGQALADRIRAYRAGRVGDRTLLGAEVTQAARRLDAACTAYDAYNR